jgi:predicted ATP-dependent endonuclease of OLD family
MISDIKLKFGSSTSADSLTFNLTPVTIFVGPNNSGKSKILLEIEQFCQQGYLLGNEFIVDNLTFVKPQDPLSEIRKYTIEASGVDGAGRAQVRYGKGSFEQSIAVDDLVYFLNSDKPNRTTVCTVLDAFSYSKNRW